MGLVTIGLTGDVMLGRTLDHIIGQKGYKYPWGNMLPMMNSIDINIINLETTLTTSDIKVEKTFNFRASPDKIQCLVNANVTVANLANNHILDFAEKGLLETIQTLDAVGIKHVGAGKNMKEATTPATVTKNGITIGVLGITDNEPGWQANHGPGINYLDMGDDEDYQGLIRSLEKLRKEADIAIVSIHWGPNMREEPTQRFIHFAHLLADNGADVIHGHSAHIIQGIEYYHHCLILYDTGDFVDDYMVDPTLRNDLSAYYILSVNRSGLVQLRIVPTRISSYQVNQARQEDHDWVIARIQHLSSRFNTQINEEGTIDLHSASQPIKHHR